MSIIALSGRCDLLPWLVSVEPLGLSGKAGKSRPWLLELLWPSLTSDVAADTALRTGMYVCFACAVIGMVGGVARRQPAAGVLLLLFLTFLGIGIRAGSRLAVTAAFTYSVVSFFQSLRGLGLGTPLVLTIIIVGLLLGAVRSSFYLANWRKSNASRQEPPELPDKAFVMSAPDNFKAMALRDAGWEDRIKNIWSVMSPMPDIMAGISFVFVAALLVLAAAVQVLLLPTSSMEPTLLKGDRVIAMNTFVMGEVRRGDIVAFRMPNARQSTTLKRVVGVTGDHIQVRDGKLVLNGHLIDEPYVKVLPMSVHDFPDPRYPNQNLAPELRGLIYQMYLHDVKNGELIVPPAAYFVLGDNRSVSLDSRFFGPVSKSDIVGRAIYVFANTNNLMAHAIPRVPFGG